VHGKAMICYFCITVYGAQRTDFLLLFLLVV